MRRSVLLLALVACSKRLPPKDPSLETTYPKTTAVASLPQQLRVVTCNVHFETASNVIRGIREDRELRDADLIIMQEVARDESVPDYCSAACALGKELGYHAIYAPGHAQGNGSHGVAIVSRAPIKAAEILELPYFNVKFNSGRRVAVVATIDVAGKPVTVYGVHLDNRLSVKERKKQMTPVLEHARRQTTPVIIGGDFNTSPYTWIANVVPVPTGQQDNKLEKLVREFGFDTPVTDSGPTFRYLGMRLDAIYTRGFETIRFSTANAKNISDHVALWATMRPK